LASVAKLTVPCWNLTDRSGISPETDALCPFHTLAFSEWPTIDFWP